MITAKMYIWVTAGGVDIQFSQTSQSGDTDFGAAETSCELIKVDMAN